MVRRVRLGHIQVATRLLSMQAHTAQTSVVKYVIEDLRRSKARLLLLDKYLLSPHPIFRGDCRNESTKVRQKRDLEIEPNVLFRSEA